MPGLDADEARAYLTGDADHAARQAGVNGAPCFIFNRQHALAGAHPPEVLFQTFDLANQETAEASECA